MTNKYINTKIKYPLDQNNNSNCNQENNHIEELNKNENKLGQLLKNNHLEFNSKKWRWFFIKNIFLIPKIKKYSSIPEKEGNIPFVSSTSINNGVTKYVNSIPSYDGQCISVSTNGKCFDCFLQEGKICVSTDVEILVNNKINKNILLFIITILKCEQFKWGFGRKCKNNAVANTRIKLPADQNGNPDWDYMTNYIKELKKNEIKNSELAQPLKINKIEFIIRKWKKFKINDLFDVKGSKTTSPEKININENLKYNYVTTKNQNNGVELKSNIYTELGNCITIDSATIGAVFYQKDNFIASDHVEILRNDNLNQFTGLFIVSLLKREQFRYGYGRKWNQLNIKNTNIYLPVDQNGKPDWEFIEAYIQSLPYSKYL